MGEERVPCRFGWISSQVVHCSPFRCRRRFALGEWRPVPKGGRHALIPPTHHRSGQDVSQRRT
jgi:hypothetical protein